MSDCVYASSRKPVARIPLKSGEEDVNGTRGRNMKTFCKSGYVPDVPPKSLKLLTSPCHSSCADITLLSPLVKEESSRGLQNSIMRSASVDFLNRSVSAQPQCETFASTSFAREPPQTNGHAYEEPPQTNAHAYEEVRNVFHDPPPSFQPAPPPSSGHPTTSELPHHDPRISLQSPTGPTVPLIADSSRNVHAQSHFSPRSSRNCLISQKCACALVTSFIVCAIVSIASITMVVLVSAGKLQTSSNSDSIDELEETLELLMDAQRERINATARRVEEEVIRLNNSIREMALNNSEVKLKEIQSQLSAAVQDLTPDQISATFGSIAASALAQCRHLSNKIGISSTQEIGYSGKFYNTQGFVITGVTCATSLGFMPSLKTSDNLIDNITRTEYECVCSRLASMIRGDSASCEIHYWQCPTTST